MRILEDYIRKFDYYLSKGRGISIFDYHNDINDLLRYFDDASIKYHYIDVGNMEEYHQEADPDEDRILIIHQKVNIKDLKQNIDLLVNKIIYGTYHSSTPVVFVSMPAFSEYEIKITSSRIHYDYESVENDLLVEQLISLLDLVNFKFLSPDLTNTLDRNFYTPIEQLFREQCEINKIDFKPQARFGNYYVDFVISHDGNKAIVECDGKEYHDRQKDIERDKSISKYGIPIFRFSGAELYHDAAGCLNRVLNGLDYSKKKKYELDDDLDNDQKRAIEEIHGPVRVLAPAGSGKTKVLTNRIVNMVNKGIDPNQILALAFNKRAAEQMVDRIAQRGIPVAKNLADDGVVIKTFHSFGYEIIRNSYKWTFNKKDESRITRQLTKTIVDGLNIDHWEKKDVIDKFMEGIRVAKMELPSMGNYTVETKVGEVIFEPYFQQYMQLQFSKNFFNFDDMIYLALRAILDDKNLRRSLQQKFNYILIDEFQDLNQAQILMMQTLALPINNLFIVGDDDQMIYGFTGARVEHIVNFPKRYSFSKQFVLSTNYRSAKKVVKHSSWLINHNSNRVNKYIKPHSTNKTGIFEVTTAEDIYRQAVNAVNWIKKIKDTENQDWKDFAMLFRYYEYQYPITMILDSEKIPHTPINYEKLFLKDPCKDLHAYLTIILHPGEARREDFSRILKRPNKYINNKIIDQITNWESFISIVEVARSIGITLEKWKAERLLKFIEQIKKLQNYAKKSPSPFDLVNAITEEFQIKEFYKDVKNVIKDVETASDEIILEIFLSVARTFTEINTFYEYVHYQITDPDAEPISELEEQKNENEVLISTIHKTKGNEFGYVVYFNLTDKEKMNLKETEEERRVCYVGLTRAKEGIHITAPKGKYSSFLPEILLNPEYYDISNEKLNEIKDDFKFEISKDAENIEFNEKMIGSYFEEYPELKGGKLLINTQFATQNIDTEISSLYRIYPELKGAPMKKFSIFSSFRTGKRIKKINKAQKRIEKLNIEKKNIITSVREKRLNEVNNVRLKIKEIREEISKIKEAIMEKHTDLYEINHEIKYRELLKTSNN